MQSSHAIYVLWWDEIWQHEMDHQYLNSDLLSLIKIFLDKVLPARIIICNIHFRAFTPSAINFILKMFLKYLFVMVSCLQKKGTCCLFAKENVRFTAEIDVYVQGHFFPCFICLLLGLGSIALSKSCT